MMVEMLTKIGIRLALMAAMIAAIALIGELVPLLDYVSSLTVVFAGFSNLASIAKPYFRTAVGFINLITAYSSNPTLIRSMIKVLITWTIIKKPLMAIIAPIETAVYNLIKD